MKSQALTVRRRAISLLGSLGFILCITGCLGVWYAESRIERVLDKVLGTVEQSLARIDRRVVEAQRISAQCQITVDEIEQHLHAWTAKEAGEQLDTRFDVAGKAQQVALRLGQAKAVFELSEDIVLQAQQVLEAGNLLGLSFDEDAVDPLLARLRELMQTLEQVGHTAEGLMVRLQDDQQTQPEAERIKEAITIIARLLTTFADVDSGLAAVQSRLTEAQCAIQQISTRTHARIVAAAICATLLLLWMAAGQVSLWQLARKH